MFKKNQKIKIQRSQKIILQIVLKMKKITRSKLNQKKIQKIKIISDKNLEWPIFRKFEKDDNSEQVDIPNKNIKEIFVQYIVVYFWKIL